ARTTEHEEHPCFFRSHHDLDLLVERVGEAYGDRLAFELEVQLPELPTPEAKAFVLLLQEIDGKILGVIFYVVSQLMVTVLRWRVELHLSLFIARLARASAFLRPTS